MIYRYKLRMIYTPYGVIRMRDCEKLLSYIIKYDIMLSRGGIMAKNYLLIYSEQLATDIELLCQKEKTL